jgi:hypothetical protein
MRQRVAAILSMAKWSVRFSLPSPIPDLSVIAPPSKHLKNQPLALLSFKRRGFGVNTYEKHKNSQENQARTFLRFTFKRAHVLFWMLFQMRQNGGQKWFC